MELVMSLKAGRAYQGATAQRGFGLIDVSLGIIAGIGLLVGAVVLFQQITNTRTVAETSQATFNLSTQIRTYSKGLDQVSDLPGVEASGLFLLDLTGYGLGPDIGQRISAYTDPASPNFFFMRVDELRPRICSRLALDPGTLGANAAGAVCDRDDPADDLEHLIITFRR